MPQHSVEFCGPFNVRKMGRVIDDAERRARDAIVYELRLSGRCGDVFSADRDISIK